MTGPGNPPQMRALVAELTRIGERAAHAADTARRATALLPALARGTDPSGAVSVTVDADGLPTAVRVGADWADRVTPSGFASAVTSACHAAEQARLAEWGERLADTSPAAPSSTPWDGPPSHPGGTTGSPAASLDDLQRRLHTAARARPQPTEQPTGTTGRDASGRLAVTITRGGVRSCTADPAWVARQSAARLATAVGEAVHDARQRRPSVPAPGDRVDDHVDGHNAEMHRILQDALATLDDMTGRAAAPPGRGPAGPPTSPRPGRDR